MAMRRRRLPEWVRQGTFAVPRSVIVDAGLGTGSLELLLRLAACVHDSNQVQLSLNELGHLSGNLISDRSVERYTAALVAADLVERRQMGRSFNLYTLTFAGRQGGGVFTMQRAHAGDPLLKAGELEMLAALKYCSGAKGCFPAVAKLEELLGLSEASVLRRLDALEEHSVIRRESGHGGRNTRYHFVDVAKIYEFDSPQVKAKPASTRHQCGFDPPQVREGLIPSTNPLTYKIPRTQCAGEESKEAVSPGESPRSAKALVDYWRHRHPGPVESLGGLGRNLRTWLSQGVEAEDIQTSMDLYHKLGAGRPGYPAWRNYVAQADLLLARARRARQAESMRDADRAAWTTPSPDDPVHNGHDRDYWAGTGPYALKEGNRTNADVD